MLEDFRRQDHTPSHNLHGKAQRHLARRTPDKLSRLWPLSRRQTKCRYIQARLTLPMLVHMPVAMRFITARHMVIYCTRSLPRRQTTPTARTISPQEVTRRILVDTLRLAAMALRCSCLAVRAHRRILRIPTRNKEDRTPAGRSCHPFRRAALVR